MYANIFTAKIQEQLNLSWRWKFSHSLSLFIYHLSKNHKVPCKITYKTGYLFSYNTFTVQWKVQILAATLLLTLKEIVRTDMLLRQNARQNRQFIAEMFLLISEFFGWRRFEQPTKRIKWSSFCTKTGPVRELATYCQYRFNSLECTSNSFFSFNWSRSLSIQLFANYGNMKQIKEMCVARF